MKKKLLKMMSVFLILLFLLAVAAGCQGTVQPPDKSDASSVPAQSSSAADPQKKIKIGFDNLSTGIDYCNSVEISILDAAKKAGNVEVIVATCELDTQKALANVDTFLVQGVDLIIDFCVVPETGKAIVEKASKKSVPVISLDVPYEGAYYYGCDNLESGKVAGRYAGERIKKDWNGKIDSLVLTYPEEAGEEVKDRVIGMREGIEEVLGVKIPDEDVYFFDDQNNQPLVVKGIVTDFLTSHPDQKNIVIGNLDDPTAMGAVSAVEIAGRQNDVFIISTGGDPTFRDNVRKDNPPKYWIGSVAYFPEKYGEFLIPYAMDILNGKNPENARYMQNVMLTHENLNEYYPE